VDAPLLGWIGGRLRLDGPGPARFDLSAYGGRSASRDHGAWWHGALGAASSTRLGAVLVNGRAELFGLRYGQPFDYTAYGISLEPRAMAALGPMTAVLRGQLTRGRWSFPARGLPGTTGADGMILNGPEATGQEDDGRLSVTGATLSLGRALGSVWVEATGEIYTARNDEADGTFAAIGASASFSVGRADARLGLSRWDSPVGDEVGASLTIGLPVSDELLAFAAVEKTTTDPLYGSRGSTVTSLGLTWRATRHEWAPRTPPVAEIGEPVQGGRKVRFRLPANDAERVALMGSFTGWTPRSMTRDGDHWVLDIVLNPGLHQFVFILDGERWYLPDNAPGIVDDGWGRRNASLVVQE
jgi:hypothetical protein